MPLNPAFKRKVLSHWPKPRNLPFSNTGPVADALFLSFSGQGRSAGGIRPICTVEMQEKAFPAMFARKSSRDQLRLV